MTYMLLLNCALKLVEEIIIYYDARSKKHQITIVNYLNQLLLSAIPVVSRSMPWVCGRSLAWIAGSNPTWDIDVCLL